eukprot:2785410-Amphidinium_carterae.1
MVRQDHTNNASRRRLGWHVVNDMSDLLSRSIFRQVTRPCLTVCQSTAPAEPKHFPPHKLKKLIALPIPADVRGNKDDQNAIGTKLRYSTKSE